MILDGRATLLGRPWRGNLRQTINDADTAVAFLEKLFNLCRVSDVLPNAAVTVAIDAPLAFPEALIELLTKGKSATTIEESAANPYLYRFTERRLVTPRSVPLSVVKDMIGSQSTKAIHATHKFTPKVESLGVWSDGGATRFMETYPAACRRRAPEFSAYNPVGDSGHVDIVDAGVCALIAYHFATAPEGLEHPIPGAPFSEGWIWLPTENAKIAR